MVSNLDIVHVVTNRFDYPCTFVPEYNGENSFRVLPRPTKPIRFAYSRVEYLDANFFRFGGIDCDRLDLGFFTWTPGNRGLALNGLWGGFSGHSGGW